MDLNNKPLFYKASNPQLAEVIQVATHLFYWDETANMPIEVQNGEALMAPVDIEGDYIIWSDTYTLGFTSELDAHPIFFSDGGQGPDKILRMINSVANRLGAGKFADLSAALEWASNEPRIYVEDYIDNPTPSSSGLIAHLDASNPISYSGSGNVWTDLTGNGHNATVSGSYNSSIASGVFEFNSIGQLLEFSTPATKSDFSLTVNNEMTFQAWVYVPNHTSDVQLFGKGTVDFLQGNYGMRLFTKNNQSDRFSITTDGGNQGWFETGQPSNTWQLITFQAFVGVPNEQVSPTHPWYDTDRVLTRHYFNDTVRMNQNYPALDYYVNAGQPNTAAESGEFVMFKDAGITSSNLKIGELYVYDKILTAQEVADVYNNTKSRYGL